MRLGRGSRGARLGPEPAGGGLCTALRFSFPFSHSFLRRCSSAWGADGRRCAYLSQAAPLFLGRRRTGHPGGQRRSSELSAPGLGVALPKQNPRKAVRWLRREAGNRES